MPPQSKLTHYRILPTVAMGSYVDDDGGVRPDSLAPDKYLTDQAYAWADLMLESRKLPESG